MKVQKTLMTQSANHKLSVNISNPPSGDRQAEVLEPPRPAGEAIWERGNTTADNESLNQFFARTIASSANAQIALSTICQRLMATLSADYCWVGLINTDHQGGPQLVELLSMTLLNYPEQALIQFNQAFLTLMNLPAIAQSIATEGISQIADLQQVSDLQSEDLQSEDLVPPLNPKLHQSIRSSQPIRAILGTQFKLYENCQGLIVFGRLQPHQWREQDVQLLEKVTDQVAIAANATQLEQNVYRQRTYQQVMDRLVSAIRNAAALEHTYQLAIDGVISALGISRGSLIQFKSVFPFHRQNRFEWLIRANASVEYDAVQSLLLARRAEGGSTPASPPTPRLKFALSQCALLQHLCLESQTPVAIANLNKEISSTEVAPLFNPKQKPAVLLVPLEHQETILGCLVFQHRQVRTWLPEEISFVQLVATQVSTAIIQQRTLRQVQSLVEERTAQLERSLEVQAKLYEKTRQQVEQLRSLNKRQDEFLSTVSHELLTPLTSMTLAIRMLRQGNLSPERQQKYLDILEQQCLQETTLINDFLALQNLEAGKLHHEYQAIDVRYLVQNVAQSFEEQWSTRGLLLTINLPERPTNVMTDLESLNRILVELLTNAGKYAASGTMIRLSLTQDLEQPSKSVTLTLTNLGSPIQPEEMPRIFDRFCRGEGVTQQAIPGTGLGLALVKGLVEHLGGNITASSHPADQDSQNHAPWETCFTLTLPQCLDRTMV